MISVKVGAFSANHVVELIDQRGLGFQISEAFLAQCETQGATSEILSVLKKRMSLQTKTSNSFNVIKVEEEINDSAPEIPVMQNDDLIQYPVAGRRDGLNLARR